jgi:hypothetical protein
MLRLFRRRRHALPPLLEVVPPRRKEPSPPAGQPKKLVPLHIPRVRHVRRVRPGARLLLVPLHIPRVRRARRALLHVQKMLRAPTVRREARPRIRRARRKRRVFRQRGALRMRNPLPRPSQPSPRLNRLRRKRRRKTNGDKLFATSVGKWNGQRLPSALATFSASHGFKGVLTGRAALAVLVLGCARRCS